MSDNEERDAATRQLFDTFRQTINFLEIELNKARAQADKLQAQIDAAEEELPSDTEIRMLQKRVAYLRKTRFRQDVAISIAKQTNSMALGHIEECPATYLDPMMIYALRVCQEMLERNVPSEDATN